MTIMNLIRNEEGATALEYGLLAALIAGVIAAAVTALGTSVQGTFETISSKMSAATSTGS
ncbi:Flp family type IVb pilin [Pseudodesulfovibrio sp. zrk46]|uniref:Flp family type IVb pilin n=1 Tax=Pseudodesulfovibrio sp. zrk46 TaxID=2725288 RepID=UPI0014491EC1|nr:Flp family type IVb pilin [Pseudodesulfovibrio sp. zrk46]QJB55233.1 Flp family type IVb pilin [Pseudodesulfovibrio sp. zrk46]